MRAVLEAGGAASLMCWGWSVLHQGLRGVLSVTEGFNFPPSDRHLHLHSSAGPTEVQQSPLNHRSPFAQYIWITGNKITTPALLQSYFFFFFFNRLGYSLHNSVFHGFLGGGVISETSSKFFPADQTRGGPCGFTGKATVPSCGHGR